VSARPRIALIHATPVAIEPVVAAFAQGWPEAELANLLDDSLSTDRAQQKDLAPEMFPRFERLARYAVDNGARRRTSECPFATWIVSGGDEHHRLPKQRRGG